MNLLQCQEIAKGIGFDKAKFLAIFPAGAFECQWLDAYMGLFTVDADGLRDGFLTVHSINKEFPDLICTIPYIEDE